MEHFFFTVFWDSGCCGEHSRDVVILADNLNQAEERAEEVVKYYGTCGAYQPSRGILLRVTDDDVERLKIKPNPRGRFSFSTSSSETD